MHSHSEQVHEVLCLLKSRNDATAARLIKAYCCLECAYALCMVNTSLALTKDDKKVNGSSVYAVSMGRIKIIYISRQLSHLACNILHLKNFE